MGWEETSKEIAPLVERKLEIEKRTINTPARQSGEDYLEWMELKDRIAMLTFRRDWEFAQDRFAVDRE